MLTNQLKYYETEVMKLRKVRKSLNSKQRMLRKSNNELTQADAIELTRVTAEQSIVQKQLESARKQARQHGLVIQVEFFSFYFYFIYFFLFWKIYF